MKKILSLLVFMATLSKSYSSQNKTFRSLELNSNVSFAFPLDKLNYINSDETALKYNMGFTLNTMHFTMTANCSMPAEDLKTIANEDFDQWKNRLKQTWGIQYRHSSIYMNLDFLAGTLRFSKGISRLKNPVISVPSPLSGSTTMGAGISPSLPSASSAETPKALAFVISPGSLTNFLPVVQFGILETGENFSGIYRRFSTKIVPSLSLSLCMGFFCHGHENNSSWFQNQRYYREKKYLAMEGSANFSWNIFSISCAVGIHENPFGKPLVWSRISHVFQAGNFSLGIATFFSDPQLISSSGTFINTREQIFINPQYRIYSGKNSIHLGFTAGASFRETKTRFREKYNDYNGKASVRFTARGFSTQLNGGTNYSTENGIYEYSGGIKISVPFRNFTLGSAFSFKNEDETKNTWSGEFYLNCRKGLLKNASAGFSIKENLGEKSWNSDIGIKFRHRKKFCTINGTIALAFKKNRNSS